VSAIAPCEQCLRRAWLVGRLAGHLEPVRARIAELLALDDEALLAAVGGERQGELAGELQCFHGGEYLERADAAGLSVVCRCDPRYPPRLAELESAPAVLHVAGELDRFVELAASDPVAVVGSRRGSPYGREVCSALARGLAAAGVPVVSGMALGIDGAAHRGALDGGPATIAVLPSGADRPYPASARGLYARILSAGAAVSELPPGCSAWRWTFTARNRIIAGLSAMTVVVEAAQRSGALTTAKAARDLGRPIGAVPGRVSSALSAGPHGLLKAGAMLVTEAQDVLDELFGAGVRKAAESPAAAPLAPELQALKGALGAGLDATPALRRAGIDASQGIAALAALELLGHIRREAGGRYSVLLA
jgi:DNA processing protein